MTVSLDPAVAGETTIGRLLDERVLRGAEVLLGDDLLDRPVQWCHALSSVLRDDGGDLSGVVVLADAAELDDRLWTQLAGSGCAAVFVRSDRGVRPRSLPPRLGG